MASSRALTGGTRDVNPQYFRTQALGSSSVGGNKTTVAESAIPVQRLNNKNRSMVMEVLKITYIPKHTNQDNDAWAGIATSRPPDGKPNAAQGYWVHITKITTNAPVTADLTDGAGHGLLVAADKLYSFFYEGTAVANAQIDYQILYRWKNVSLTEYIGIVQSSQL